MVDWSIFDISNGRLSLADSGQISWQQDKTNPLPGDVIGHLAKGDTVLTPVFTKSIDVEGDDCPIEMIALIQNWISDHIKQILAPLYRIKDDSDHALDGVGKIIGDQVYNGLGVIHRSEIEKHVSDLTPEQRNGLRKKRIKMGPILVFMPELVKPAAISLKAILWGVWNSQRLPMDKPADGRVSIVINPEDIDRNYYRAIGYPVFGELAIRIDMLDRVITDIYDQASEGCFQAQHKYMEWLGCGEDGLYSVLNAMGFKKLKSEKTENNDQSEEVKDEIDKKLAIFFIKKGKISDKPVSNRKKISKNNKKSKKKDKNVPKSYQSAPKSQDIDNESPFSILKQLQK